MGKRELPEDLNTLKVTELKEELKQRGLTSSGNKADLVSRLQEFLKNQAKEESGKEAPAEEVNGKEHQQKEKEKEQEEAKKAQEEEEKAKKEQLEKDQREKEQKEKEEKEKKEKELREKEEKETKEKEAKEKEAKEKEVKDRELREKELKEKEKKEKELKEKELKAEKSKEEEQNKTEKDETEDEPKKRKADEAEPLSTSGRIIKPPTSSSSSSSSSLSSSSSSTPSSKRPRTWSSQPEAITISTDILKDMLPSPSSLSLSSSQVDTEMEEATRNNNNNNNENNNNNNNNSNNSGDRRVSQQVYSTPAKRVTKPDPSIRDVPSSKKPASNTLFIDKFVRPFTLNQVKQLLQQTGDIEYFWMNQVKSQAYVTFKTEEQATVTREAIYDLEWPIGNNSRLRAEFASSDEAKKAADHHDQSRSTPSSSGTGQSTPRGSENSTSGNLRDSKGVNREERGGERGTKKNAKSSKALEEIFRKTEAKPAIYWLPLSQEQIAAKQKAR